MSTKLGLVCTIFFINGYTYKRKSNSYSNVYVKIQVDNDSQTQVKNKYQIMKTAC